MQTTMKKFNLFMNTYAGWLSWKTLKSWSDAATQAAETEIAAQEKLKQILKNNSSIRALGADAYLKKSEELFNMASEMQQKGVIGDEVLVGGMQVLGGMGFDDKVIKTIMPVVSDLAVQQKGYNVQISDTEQIAKQLGKAIAGNVGGLGRMGIVLTSSQQKMLKNMTAMQRSKYIAELLSKRVGGLNEALGKTDRGAKIQWLNNWSDRMEDIGKRLIPLEGKLFRFLNGFIPQMTDGIQKFFDGVEKMIEKCKPVFEAFKKQFAYLGEHLIPELANQSPLLKNIFENVIIPGAVLTADALGGLFKAIDFVYNTAKNLINFVREHWLAIFLTALPFAITGVQMALDTFRVHAALAAAEGKTLTFWNWATGGSLTALKGGFIKSIGAVKNFAGAMKLAALNMLKFTAAVLTNPITWIIAGIAAVVAATVLLIKHWDKVKKVTLDCWNKIKEGAAKCWQKVTEAFQGAIDWLTGSVWGRVVSAIFPVIGIAALLIKNWDKVKAAVMDFGKKSSGVLGDFWQKTKDVFTSIGKVISDCRQKVTEAFQGAIDWLTGSVWGNVISMIFPVVGVVALLIKHWDKVKETVINFWNKTVEVLGSLWTKIKEIFGAIGNFVKEHFVDILLTALGPVGLIVEAVTKISDGIKNIDKGGSIKIETVSGGGIPDRSPRIKNSPGKGQIGVDINLTNKTDTNAAVITRIMGGNDLGLVPAY